MTSFIPPEAPQPHVEATPLAIPNPEALKPTVQPEIAISPSRKLSGWCLWIPLTLQAALILAAPAQNTYTYVSGRTVTLQTVPVDPYDLLRGYSQTLNYSISDPNVLRKLPGGTWFSQQSQGQNASFYIVLEEPVSQAPGKTKATPPAWKPIKISGDRPTHLSSNQVALKGQYNGWRIVYGLETYYMPEDQREQINGDIGQAQNQQALKVDIKVDSSGNAVLMNLWVNDRQYQ
jgi:uncharacterized membrane-anchored protein